MSNIVLDASKSLIDQTKLEAISERINNALMMVKNKNGIGKEMLGWVDLPVNYNKEEFAKIKAASERIRSNSDVFISIGIGGSYLGAKAVIEALNPSFFNKLNREERNFPEIFFAGKDISGSYLSDLIRVIGDRDVSLNIISKSGTTTEPAIAFRILKDFMENKYGKEEAKKRIFATTDAHKGALKQLADKEGYETFVVPDDIGGRYSVLTAVGLLPIAVAGIDIDELMDGAAQGRDEYLREDKSNPALIYASLRNILYGEDKKIELLVNYEPKLHFFAEWWKQLFGESEGKEGKGIFPASVDFTTDLHSLGQYIQEGERHLMETTLFAQEPLADLEIPSSDDDLDGLNYLAGKNMNFVNEKAMLATILAHSDGGVPNILIKLSKLTPLTIGQLIYFFETACTVSAYALGVNPSDQPGVEAYKKNMFKLLGKPGA